MAKQVVRLPNCRRLSLERLEDRCLLSADVWDLAADYAASFVGGLPQNNPNGVWRYLAVDSSTSSLIATTIGGQGGGWLDVGGGPDSYALGGTAGFPSHTFAGHGPNRVVWTAPAAADFGGVELTGQLSQGSTEPARQMQLRIYKNDYATPVVTVNANFSNQTAIVPLPMTRLGIKPGDTLTIWVDGNGPQGNGINTSVAWNVVITEYRLSGDYSGNGVVDAADYVVWRKNYLSTENLEADGDSNGHVNANDREVWAANFGNEQNPGGTAPVYHPAAVIVQTTGVTLPDGSPLNITGTQTQGLQEAINYSAAFGWEVYVLPGTYTLNAHLDFPALQVRTFRLQDVTLNFTNSVTDYGIRYDSTMMFDWCWKGGALNAPNAAHGVLFQARTPHPRDGVTHGTIGVVDSRFEFQVNITAKTFRVTMDMQWAVVTGVALYFQNVTQAQVHVTNFSGDFANLGNVFSAPRTDDPMPFDLLSPAGQVTVLPRLGTTSPTALAQVFKPDGTTLNVMQTKTVGLQEAFDFAAQNNLDVLVFGRGVLNSSPFVDYGHYYLWSTLSVSPLVGRTYKFYSVSFDSVLTKGTSFIMSDVVDSDFELTGQITPPFADTGILIKPLNIGVTNKIRIQHSGGRPYNNGTSVKIDPSVRSIEGNEFYFQEVLGGYNNMVIANPSATTYFRNNFLRTIHDHDFTANGLQLGQSAANADRLTGNSLIVQTNPDGGPSQLALQIWGTDNTFTFLAHDLGLTTGVRFEASSANNLLRYYVIQATTPIINLGAHNMIVTIGSGTGAPFDVGNSAVETPVENCEPVAMRAVLEQSTANLLIDEFSRSKRGMNARAAAFETLDEERELDLAFFGSLYDRLANAWDDNLLTAIVD